MSRGRLYSLLLLACTAGYVWLAFSYFDRIRNSENTFGVCLIKHATDIPCPSCGSTRSALAFLSGDFSESLLINPLGILLLFIMVIAPIWILKDLYTGESSFFIIYQKAERSFQKKIIAIPSILLILTNWIWNIYKGL
jgi:hypothetical protein